MNDRPDAGVNVVAYDVAVMVMGQETLRLGFRVPAQLAAFASQPRGSINAGRALPCDKRGAATIAVQAARSSIIAALLTITGIAVCRAQSAKSAQRLRSGREVADLGISDSDGARQSDISRRAVRVRNSSPLPGRGRIDVSVVDSTGVPWPGHAPASASVEVPASGLGGAEGRVVSIGDSPVHDALIDSLTRSGTRFGLRARVQTDGGDSNVLDNLRTRWLGRWQKLSPNAAVPLTFTIASRFLSAGARTRVAFAGLPPGVQIVKRSSTPSGHDKAHSTYTIHLASSSQLAHGSKVTARLTVTDASTGRVLHDDERVAVYDTTPPKISSYRAILLSDGSIAIQLYAGDRHSTVREGGVASWYSLDSGSTWHRQVHTYHEDDLGRPAVFETVLGRFPTGSVVLVGVSVEDMVGNSNTELPSDAAVFAAPANAERVLSAFQGSVIEVEGNPLFLLNDIYRRAYPVEVDDSRLSVRERSGDGRFDSRRLKELRVVPDSLRAWNVDVQKFERRDVPVVRFSNGGAPRAILCIVVK